MLFVAVGLAILMQASAPTGAATISGRVLEQGTKSPVAGAQVTLITERQGPPPNPFAYRPKTATADESGRFVFADVEPGRYRLTAQKTGFATPIAMNGLPPLDVKSGNRIDNVEISLQRGGVISGRVVDQAGEPLVDAHVTVLRKFPTPPRSARGAPPVLPARLANRLMPAGSGQTNDLGEFRIHSLLPGEYFVQAAPQSVGGGPFAAGTGAGTTMLPTFFPGVSDQAAAQPIFVTAGQTASEVVVRMMVARAFQVSGTVVDETGRAVANAMVRLAPEGDAGPPLPMMRPFGQARTDAGGAFLLDNVTDGTYTLIAVAPLVTAKAPPNAGAGGGGIGFSTFGGTSSWGQGGGVVMTESNNGTTVQYRDDTGTKTPVIVNESSVTGLQIVVHRPSGQQ